MLLCKLDSRLTRLHWENTGPWKIGQIFIISCGPILVKCPSVSDSLSAGSASGDNSDMITRPSDLTKSVIRFNVIQKCQIKVHLIPHLGVEIIKLGCLHMIHI